MKKIAFVACVAIVSSLSLNAKFLSDDEILNLYTNAKNQGISVSIEKREKLEGAEGFEAVTLKFTKGENSQKDIVFFKDHFMFPDILDTKKEIAYKSKLFDQLIKTDIGVVYSKQKDNILKIGNDKKKPTLVIFSDPECPYCRAEIAKIDDMIKTYNIEMIFTPVHAESAYQKSALILKESKNKNNSQKVAILKKYYGDIDVEISKDDVEMVAKTAEKYFKAGLSSVPMNFQKSDLIKK